MAFNFTRSRDGQRRTTIQVSYRLTRQDVRSALAASLAQDPDFDAARMSQTEIQRRVRETLRQRGGDWRLWHEDVDDADECMDLALDLLDGAFPHWHWKETG